MTSAYNVRQDNFDKFLANWTSHFISWISANLRGADPTVVMQWHAMLGGLVMQKEFFDQLKKVNIPIEEKQRLLDKLSETVVPFIMSGIMPLAGPPK